MCVHYTAIDAHQNDYHIRVVTDAVAGSSPEAHNYALKAIQYLQRNALITTADVEAALADDVAPEDETFMREAIRLSKLAVEHGNDPFGAVLVKNGKIVFSNENQIYTKHDPTFHGEAGLIREFCEQTAITDLHDYTLYSSCETLLHVQRCNGMGEIGTACVWRQQYRIGKDSVKKAIAVLRWYLTTLSGSHR